MKIYVKLFILRVFVQRILKNNTCVTSFVRDLFKVINREHSDYLQRILESIYIKSKQSSLYKQMERLLDQNVMSVIYSAYSI